MQAVPGHTFVFVFFVGLFIVLTISGCGTESGVDQGAVSEDNFSAPLPELLQKLQITDSNLVVKVIVDKGSGSEKAHTLTNLQVDMINSTFTGRIPEELSVGPHTFALEFFIKESDILEVRVATTSSIPINVIGGSTTSIDFSTVKVDYPTIEVTPTNPEIANGTIQQFIAMGIFPDGTKQDLTAQITWSSSDPTVAGISNAAGTEGSATSNTGGSTTISAVLGDISTSTLLTVTNAQLVSIAITPPNPSIALGTTQQLSATGTFTDNSIQDLTSQVTWSSSDPTVAGISNAAGTEGSATGVAVGDTAITATDPTTSISGSIQLTITPTLTWTPTGSLAANRRDHTATLLGNGKVLVMAGTATGAELYDPATGTFNPITATNHGQGSSATLLADGEVLIVGGSTTQAQIFNPLTEAFSSTGSLNHPRSFHTATRLKDGRVLITGGGTTSGVPAVAELFDPATGLFTLTGNLNTPARGATAALLPDGRVLVVGGTIITGPGVGKASNSADLFDPITETFSIAGPLITARTGHQAVVLATGKVLILSGGINSAELFDPTTGTFITVGNTTTQHSYGTATLLPNGQVLVAGGTATTNSAEIYDPVNRIFTATASMTEARQQHTATLLLNGNVLVIGGFDFGVGSDLSSAELFR